MSATTVRAAQLARMRQPPSADRARQPLDVSSDVRTGAGQADVGGVDAERVHPVQDVDLLVDRGRADRRRLQAVAQRLVVEHHRRARRRRRPGSSRESAGGRSRGASPRSWCRCRPCDSPRLTARPAARMYLPAGDADDMVEHDVPDQDGGDRPQGERQTRARRRHHARIIALCRSRVGGGWVGGGIGRRISWRSRGACRGDRAGAGRGSRPGFGVVSSRSPRKIELAPARKQSACASSVSASGRRSGARTRRASGCARSRSCAPARADRPAARPPSGVPATRTQHVDRHALRMRVERCELPQHPAADAAILAHADDAAAAHGDARAPHARQRLEPLVVGPRRDDPAVELRRRVEVVVVRRQPRRRRAPRPAPGSACPACSTPPCRGRGRPRTISSTRSNGGAVGHIAPRRAHAEPRRALRPGARRGRRRARRG